MGLLLDACRRRLRSRAVLSCVALVFAYGTCFASGAADAGPSNAELDAVRAWFKANPPNGTNRAERLSKMGVIQAAADQLSKEDAKKARVGWNFPKKAPKLDSGILRYLYLSVDDAVKEIHRTRVSHGVAGWHLYNMGYVFKTPDSCFAFDVSIPKVKRLVRDLDFAMISHDHEDHTAGGLAEAMIKAGKPVITGFLPGSTITKEPAEFHFGAVRVKVDIGDHSPGTPERENNMLMFQVDCGESGGNATIYHSGDGANYEKMKPDRPVDVFIPHVACSGMAVAEAICHIHPKVALVSHVLELTHPPDGARWRYDFANKKIQDFPENEAVVLTWGERFVLPGTEFKN